MSEPIHNGIQLPVPFGKNADREPDSFHEAIDSVSFADTVSFMPKSGDSDLAWRRLYENKVDNSLLNYLSIRLRCGVVAMCRTNVLTTCPSVLQDLNRDLSQCLEIMPWSVHALIRRTRIWVNLTYSHGPKDNPTFLSHSTAHHHEAWLLWARDRPDKVHGIEIYDCKDYQRMRLHWNGCGLIMHELCHLLHQHALKDGLSNRTILDAYSKAKSSGLYEKTLRRDWAGQDEDTDLAYAMVDHKEFFAEMSVCFLSDTYQHLDKGDKNSMYHCSPPVLEPGVVERVRQKRVEMSLTQAKDGGIGNLQQKLPPTLLLPTKHIEVRKKSAWHPLNLSFQFCKPKMEMIKRNHPPCNKFYPFTRGQLREHDKELYGVMCDLWREIELWEDPEDEQICGKGFNKWFPFGHRSHFRTR